MDSCHLCGSIKRKEGKVLETERLYEFHVLAKTLNYSTAARSLFISQSALTKHICALEEELGARLFLRSTHGVSLTEAGFFLQKRVPALLEESRHLSESMLSLETDITGSISLGCVPEFLYASHLQLFIGQFSERYPHIKVLPRVLSEGTPDETLTDRDLDILITPCELSGLPPFCKRSLVHDHAVQAVVYPGHRLIGRQSVRLEELAGEILTVPFAEEPFGPYQRNFVLAQKLTHGRISMLSAANLYTALFYVMQGQGILLAPGYVQGMLPQGLFTIPVTTKGCVFQEYIYLCNGEEAGAAQLFYQEYVRKYQMKEMS